MACPRRARKLTALRRAAHTSAAAPNAVVADCWPLAEPTASGAVGTGLGAAGPRSAGAAAKITAASDGAVAGTAASAAALPASVPARAAARGQAAHPGASSRDAGQAVGVSVRPGDASRNSPVAGTDAASRRPEATGTDTATTPRTASVKPAEPASAAIDCSGAAKPVTVAIMPGIDGWATACVAELRAAAATGTAARTLRTTGTG
jgi:hypothetical protein